MEIELITIGTELLLGQVLDTHQQWLGQRLAERGCPLSRKLTVPDNGPAICGAVQTALGRTDLVITTGGLGPTSDDVTRGLLADLLARPLGPDASVAAHIEGFFERRNRPMAGSVLVQAQVPEGAVVFPNEHGTAPGLAIEASPNPFRAGGGSAWLIMLPGPPRELRPMFDDQVLPFINKYLPLEKEFHCRILRSLGIGESMVEEMLLGPLQPLMDIVPENVIGAASDNRNMLNIVFVAFLMGIALLLIPKAQAKPLLELFESVNAVIIKIVELVIVFAPVGVFALIADTITTVADDSPGDVGRLLSALGLYCITAVMGMALQMGLVYSALLNFFTPLTLRNFFRAIVPAQLVAFSTSSSAATLPVTMRTTQERLGVSEEVAAFVLPLGATINMDGTALYQAVAAVFIAQTLGIDLDLSAQLTIVFMALLASIGTAAVPSAGVVMLVIILEAIGIPIAGIALILGVDRILDMCRTTLNVTGDAVVASIVSANENQGFLLPKNQS